MPALVNMHEAKTNLSKLVEQVAEGQDVIICKAGKPVARLSAYVGKVRKPGGWKDWADLGDLGDEDPEINALFYNSVLFPGEPEPEEAAEAS